MYKPRSRYGTFPVPPPSQGWQRMRWLDGITDLMDIYEFETLGDSEGQESLVCCNPWGHRIGHNLATEQQPVSNPTITSTYHRLMTIDQFCLFLNIMGSFRMYSLVSGCFHSILYFWDSSIFLWALVVCSFLWLSSTSLYTYTTNLLNCSCVDGHLGFQPSAFMDKGAIMSIAV